MAIMPGDIAGEASTTYQDD